MQRGRTIGFGLIEGMAIVAIIHWLNSWWAWPLAFALWWYHSRSAQPTVRAAWVIALASLVVILSINTNIVGQSLVVVSFGLWQLGQKFFHKGAGFQVLQAGWLGFISLTAAFSAEAIWHWPVVVVLALVYLASLAIALEFFSGGERAVRALAAAWGLIVVEASLVFSVWLVNYVLPRNLLLVPQPAVVITALGYCFGSIYLAHSASKLSKARLAEYAIIGLCLVIIVIAGTLWNGTI